MTLTVIPDGADNTRGYVHISDGSYACALGRNGLSDAKIEGDGKTPIGRFLLRRVLYRADRVQPPETTLPIATIKPTDGWCDAPEDHRYNQMVEHPYGASAEELWRDDNRYDILVVLGHNDDPSCPARTQQRGLSSLACYHLAGTLHQQLFDLSQFRPDGSVFGLDGCHHGFSIRDLFTQ